MSGKPRNKKPRLGQPTNSLGSCPSFVPRHILQLLCFGELTGRRSASWAQLRQNLDFVGVNDGAKWESTGLKTAKAGIDIFLPKKFLAWGFEWSPVYSKWMWNDFNGRIGKIYFSCRFSTNDWLPVCGGETKLTTSITDLSIASNNPQSYWHLLASCQGRLNMLDCPMILTNQRINKSIKSTVSPISLYFEYHNENFSNDLDFVILGDQSLMGAFNNIEEFWGCIPIRKRVVITCLPSYKMKYIYINKNNNINNNDYCYYYCCLYEYLKYAYIYINICV